jgi:hypothetical protein
MGQRKNITFKTTPQAIITQNSPSLPTHIDAALSVYLIP